MVALRGMLSEVAACCLCRGVEEEATLTIGSRSTPELRAALRRCRALEEPFDMACITRSAMGSLVPCATPAPGFERIVRREEIEGLSDGGILAVDWLGEAAAVADAAGACAGGSSPPPPSAVLLVFPGVGSTARRGFAGTIAHHIASVRPDFRVGVAVLQGHDGLPLRTEKVMSTAYVGCGDVGHIFEHVARTLPGVPIVVLSCSIGSAHFTRWVGGVPPEHVSGLGIVGGVVVCHGYNAADTRRAADSSGCSSFIIGEWRKMLKRSPPDPVKLAQKAPHFDMDKLLRSRTVKEWDAAAMPLYGYTDDAEVLRSSEASPTMLEAIKIPIVFVNSFNDPITPARRLIYGRVCETMANVAFLTTSRGSHMSWWQGPPWGLEQRWACNAMAELVSALATMPLGKD